MIKFLILASLTLTACNKKPEQPPTFVSAEVKAKADLYRSLYSGWAHDKCDSLGFTSLCKIAGGCSEANLFDAEAEDGRWYRSPEKDCYDTGGSPSDISKDMFIMLFPYLYLNGEKEAAKRIRSYAFRNGFVMGRGEISRTFMTPPMIAVLNQIVGDIPSPTAEPEEVQVVGFEKHLDAIYILTKSLIDGGMSDLHYKTISSLSEGSPRNALFHAIKSRYSDGDQSKAISILMDEKLFPSDRLPTSRDRCEEYLWQRNDEPRDWSPCNREDVHDGVDFIFAAWVAGQI